MSAGGDELDEMDGSFASAARVRALERGEATWDLQTDVIVIGAGLAGHCAALEAAAADAQVLLIDKQPATGGSSILSGGAIAFAGTDEQAQAGIKDSAELLYDALRRVGGCENDESLLREYAARQLDTYRWLKNHGVIFESVQLGGGQSVPRSNRVEMPEALRVLGLIAHTTGRIETMTSLPVRRLVRRAERVAGVVAGAADGALAAIQARKGVVLAAGGFSRSEHMLKL